MRTCISIFLSGMILFACSSVTTTTTTTTTTIQEKTVVHVVLVWLKEPGNQEHIQQVIKASKQLKEISYIQEMRIGKPISTDRTIVDDSFDVGLYMTFSNTEEMQSYLVAPKHKEVVRTVLKPLASRIQVYDFEDVVN